MINFTAKPVRKQLRNRPKEKQKRANPHNFLIKLPLVFLILLYERIVVLFQMTELKKENFIFVVPISPKRGYTIKNDNKTEG